MSEGRHGIGADPWPISGDRAGMSVRDRLEDHMLALLKRHQVPDHGRIYQRGRESGSDR